jgi:hypothetical protein
VTSRPARGSGTHDEKDDLTCHEAPRDVEVQAEDGQDEDKEGPEDHAPDEVGGKGGESAEGYVVRGRMAGVASRLLPTRPLRNRPIGKEEIAHVRRVAA